MKSSPKVERIAGRRTTQGKEEFLVHWKGYESLEATWEPSENLSFCKDIVSRFVSRIIPIPGILQAIFFRMIPQNRTRLKVTHFMLQVEKM